MPIKKYNKRPFTVSAISFSSGEDGNNNFEEIKSFVGNNCFIDDLNLLVIKTPEGNVAARIGDYIVKGVAGEFYPCKKEIFEKTYKLSLSQ